MIPLKPLLARTRYGGQVSTDEANRVAAGVREVIVNKRSAEDNMAVAERWTLNTWMERCREHPEIERVEWIGGGQADRKPFNIESDAV
jgi:hypothetical protein